MKHRSKMLQANRRLSAVTMINMTPLIDLAFALLIIFIITTPLLEQSIDLDLPLETQRPQQDTSALEFQTISIQADGEIFWGQTPVDMSTLDTFLKRFSEQPHPPVLNIRGDASLPYQAVIDVIDLIKNHKLERISLDTQAK